MTDKLKQKQSLIEFVLTKGSIRGILALLIGGLGFFVVSYLVSQGKVTSEVLTTVFTMILGFYFGKEGA